MGLINICALLWAVRAHSLQADLLKSLPKLHRSRCLLMQIRGLTNAHVIVVAIAKVRHIHVQIAQTGIQVSPSHEGRPLGQSQRDLINLLNQGLASLVIVVDGVLGPPKREVGAHQADVQVIVSSLEANKISVREWPWILGSARRQP